MSISFMELDDLEKKQLRVPLTMHGWLTMRKGASQETHRESCISPSLRSESLLVLLREQSWRLGFSVSSKLAQEMHSIPGGCLRALPLRWAGCPVGELCWLWVLTVTLGGQPPEG